jgi:hypothetical protein
MPCHDWSSADDRAFESSKRISFLEKRLHKRTAQLCLAMNLLVGRVKWQPETKAEVNLLKWFAIHQQQDLKHKKKGN